MNVKTSATGGRPFVRLASIAAAVLLAGLLSGPGSAADEGTKAAPFAYDCAVPNGNVRVTVDVSAAFPASGAVGEPVQPDLVTVTVGISRADIEALLPAGSAAASSTVTLAVGVAQNDRTAEATWQSLTAPSTPLPADGEVQLVHSGQVPSVTVGAPGDVVFRAGTLTLGLRADTEATQIDGAEPAPLTCDLTADQDGRLATVPVPGGADTTPTGTPATGEPAEKGVREGISVEPGAVPAETADHCPIAPAVGEMDWSEAPEPPAGDPLSELDVPTGGLAGCAYAVGIANVRKLNGAMIINDPSRQPALISVAANKHIGQRKVTAKGGYYIRISSLGNLKLPDAESTFLTFGFQPVSAKVEFENGPLTISTGNIGVGAGVVYFSVASFMQSLRLHDVKVNGVPLDVGPNCRTSKPFKVVLRGERPFYTDVFSGGLLSGEIDVPSFSGCGTGSEDLSPLFTASISGPGNLVTMNQGKTCVPAQTNTFCPPTMPVIPGTEAPKG
ncbi:DUF6801 domain-containing protein [Streptomyces sp. NPDC048473]|uniref:DUF6801 domain-containing protein n=1 Tax=unclassified Streptomyces TaxID=2593676 RepID=UPI003716FE90